MSTALTSAHAADVSHDAPAATCPNCNTATMGHYCHECGQETKLHHASTREFLHEFVGHYVALEGKLWGTLRRLMLRPGQLTNEYIQGRRVRFVQPLRLYLTFSLLFFALLKIHNGAEPADAFVETDLSPAQLQALTPEARAKVDAAVEKTRGIKAAHVDDEAEKRYGANSHGLTIAGKDIEEWTRILPWVRKPVEHFEQLSDDEKSKVLSEGFYHYAPYAIFCMMPVFALLMKLLFLGSKRRFGEHLLFALHSNAFAYALLTLTLLPVPGIVKFGLWIWLLAYLPWAMRRVYHKSRFGTAWRWLVLMALYSLTLAISCLFAIGAGVITAH